MPSPNPTPKWKRALSILLPRTLYNPHLPTKAAIKSRFQHSPSYTPGAHIFIHTLPSTPAPVSSAAISYAQAHFQGYSFLIDTVAEGWDPAWKLDSPAAGREFWKRASRAWAEEARGRVYVVLPRGGEGVRERGKGYWWRRDRWGADWRWWRRQRRRDQWDEWSEELEILLANKNVTEIVRVDLEDPRCKRWLKDDGGKLSWRKVAWYDY